LEGKSENFKVSILDVQIIAVWSLVYEANREGLAAYHELVNGMIEKMSIQQAYIVDAMRIGTLICFVLKYHVDCQKKGN
jgi:predicted membrane-bound spermidine synthase